MLSKQFGIGEVYRVHAQIRLIKQLMKTFFFEQVFEFPPEPISASFPICWKQTISPSVDADLLFTWRAFPAVIFEMIKHFRGSSFLLMATNRNNPGVLWQKLFWEEPEIYLSRKDIEQLAASFNLEILQSGYYDSPPWPDMSLPGGKHLEKVDQSVVDLVEKYESVPGHYFRAHHVYCLAKRRKS